MSKNPVILVHGYKDTSAKMQHMSRFLQEQGWQTYTPTLSPSCGAADLPCLANQLQDFIEEHLTTDQKFDIVGFSMGSIISRIYLQQLGGAARTQRFIAIASPANGTLWAHFKTKPGCVQMRYRSPLLTALNNDFSALANVECTSVWSPLDLMIFPASSSRIPHGREIKLWIAAHPLLVWQPKSLKKIAELLGS